MAFHQLFLWPFSIALCKRLPEGNTPSNNIDPASWDWKIHPRGRWPHVKQNKSQRFSIRFLLKYIKPYIYILWLYHIISSLNHIFYFYLDHWMITYCNRTPLSSLYIRTVIELSLNIWSLFAISLVACPPPVATNRSLGVVRCRQPVPPRPWWFLGYPGPSICPESLLLSRWCLPTQRPPVSKATGNTLV